MFLQENCFKVAIDTETTGLNSWTGDRPFIVSWCWFNKEETQGLIRWEVDPFTRVVRPLARDLEILREVLENPTIVKVFHNAKFDVRMLETVGLKVLGRIEDTSFMVRCFHNDLPTYSLKPLCKKILGIGDEELIDLKKACMQARREGKKKNYSFSESLEADYWMVENQKLVEKYATQDAFRTKRLFEYLEKQLGKDNQKNIYEKELKLFPITYEMETRGIALNPKILDAEISYHEKHLIESYKEVLKIGGVKELNLKSQPQVAELLYGKLKILCKDFTAKGKRAVDVNAMKRINHPIIDPFAEYKASKHALANFFMLYKKQSAYRPNGELYLHPDFQQMGAKTGRFSCRKPNMQNVANALTTRSLKPIQARRPFRPPQGFTWYTFDYSQLEVWIFAMFSGEKLMLDALLSNRDVHNETANHIWGKGRDIVAEEKVKEGKSNTRARAKMMVFGVVYGMGVGAAQALIGCTATEARNYLDEFYKAFPGIKQFMQTFSRKAERDGFIENAYGRRYFIEPGLSYRSVNYLVQGSGADLLKEKMVETTQYLKKKRIDGGLVMTIHDELIFEIKNTFATKRVLLDIKDIMEDHHGVFPIVKKFKVEIAKITSNGSWDKKEKLKL